MGNEKDILMVFFGILTIISWYTAHASCYFPQQFQGNFVMQNVASTGNGIQYSSLQINANSISVWGNCHRRNGNNFILMFNYSDTNCYTCLQLKLRSTTVLQVLASSEESIFSKCSTNEEAAEANCPSASEYAENEKPTEILLFKTGEENDNSAPKQYCPIDGKYYTNYRVHNNYMGNQECESFKSTVDSCPSGSTLNFRLRNCNFDTNDVRFECLGHWKERRDEHYLIFIDSRHLDGTKPKYRCALYKQDKQGKVVMAVSRDSTCITDLHNASSGYETFVMAPKTENPWPSEVSHGMCSFPKWMFGHWEFVNVDRDTILYKDHTSFKTYTIKCVEVQDDSDKYLVFSRTQCDEEAFNCMRISNRSKNILEFQLGMNSSHNKKDALKLCSDTNFDENSWITQGRLDGLSNNQNSLCPITGEYTGRIPDAHDLCAKLWSDCRAPEQMYYQVSDCDTQEIYEEREYQCLGHWSETNLLYTYTERKDVAAGTYECFVGSIYSDNEIFIKEAGEHCQRNVDPLTYGMKLVKSRSSYTCIDKSTKAYSTVSSTTISPKFRWSSTPKYVVTNIESNAIPDLPNETSSSAQIRLKISYVFLLSLYYIFVNRYL